MSELIHSCPACGQKYDQADEIERLTEIKDLAIKDCMAEAAENEHLADVVEVHIGGIDVLQKRVAKLEALYLRDVGSCEQLHLAAAIGNKPCVICGLGSWVINRSTTGGI